MDALTSYIPASILCYLIELGGKDIVPPLRQTYKSCCLFADVSGFTALCEAMAAKGPLGDEILARNLNSFFAVLVQTISSQGGDVFKFAGDAILVLWPPSSEDIKTTARRAAQCALDVKQKLHNVKLTDDMVLSVKVGVGVGEISILHVGGVFGRMEYIATGQPLVQAFFAESHAKIKDDVVVSNEVWELVKDYFTAAEIVDKHAFLKTCKPNSLLRKVNIFKTASSGGPMGSISNEVLNLVSKYVPSAVMPFINHSESKWADELRRITVLFVNLGLRENDIGIDKSGAEIDVGTIQKVLEAVQYAVYRYEGSLNKFLMDDKGSTLIAVFGLPPLAHEDDAVRGILSALAICAKLHELGLRPAIGITTGMAFCGRVGTQRRREYSVLGDTVNLSARLMQHATKQGGGVICDTATQYASRHRLHFEDQGKITVKGKHKPVSIWQPYPKSLSPLFKSRSDKPDGLARRSSLEASIQKAAEKTKHGGFQSIRSIFDQSMWKSHVLSPRTPHHNKKDKEKDREKEKDKGEREREAMERERDKHSTPSKEQTKEWRDAHPSHPPTPSHPTLHRRSSSTDSNPPLFHDEGANPSANADSSKSTAAPSTPTDHKRKFSTSTNSVGSTASDIPSTPHTAQSSASSAVTTGSPAPPRGLLRQATAINATVSERRQLDAATSPPPLSHSFQFTELRRSSSTTSNPSKNLMAEIHSFQMQGYARKHFESFKRKQQSLSKKKNSTTANSTSMSSLPSMSAASPPRPLLRASSMGHPQIVGDEVAAAGGDPSAVNLGNEEVNRSMDSSSRSAAISILQTTNNRNNEDYSELPSRPEWKSSTIPKNLSAYLTKKAEQLKEYNNKFVRRHSLDSQTAQGDAEKATANAAANGQGEGGKESISVNERKEGRRGEMEGIKEDVSVSISSRATANKMNITVDAADKEKSQPRPGMSRSSSLEESSLVPSLSTSRRPSTTVLGSNRIKQIKVLMPDLPHVSLTVVTQFISSIIQLKHEIWQVGQSQNVWTNYNNNSSFDFHENDFHLCLFDDSSPLFNPSTGHISNAHLSKRISDDYNFEELEEFVAMQSHLANGSNGTTVSTVSSTSIPSLSSSTPSPSIASTASVVPSGITVVLVQGGEEFRQDPLSSHKDLLLSRVHTLQQTKKGGTILIEADVGLGKTRLLSSMLAECGYPIFCAAGNPFEMNRPYSVWRDIYLSIIDREIDRIGMAIFNSTLLNNTNRRSLIESKLKLKRFMGESMDQWAPTLNEVLQLDFPDTEVTENLDSSARIDYAFDVMLNLMQMFASAVPLVVVVDDAVFLDAKSWQLVSAISTQIPSCLLILATRPINKSYMSAFATRVPQEYSDLIQSPSTTVLTIQPRPDEVIYQIACECCDEGIDEIPPSLAHLILKKAHGNPLVVKELIYALKKDSLIRIDLNDTGKKSVWISPAMQVTHLNESVTIPVPITLQCILGCRVDRLTHIQRMQLKTAAMIGDEFSLYMVRHTYPLQIDSEPEFQKELDNLVELNILKVVIRQSSQSGSELKESFMESSSSPSNIPVGSLDPHSVIYSYTNGFMREMLLSRMLEDQTKILEQRIIEIRLDLKKSRATHIINNPTVVPAASGYLLVRLNGEYTARYFVLLEKLLCMYIDEETFRNVIPRTPTILIFLEDCDLHEDEGKDNGFVLTCRMYMENMEYKMEDMKESALVGTDNSSFPTSPPANQHSFVPAAADESAPLSLPAAHSTEFFLACLSLSDFQHWGQAFIKQFELDENQINSMKQMSALMLQTLKKIEEEQMVQEDQPITLNLHAIQGQSASNLALQNNLSLLAAHHSSSAAASSSSSASSVSSPSMHPHSLAPLPVDVSTLSADAKSTMEKMFEAAIEKKEYNQQCAVASLWVKKQQKTLGMGMFVSEWKKRFVMLTDELLAFAQSRPDVTDVKKWKRPTQCLSLVVGNPTVSTSGYDSNKKIHIFSVEGDLYSKHKEIHWGRRQTVLGASSSEEAKRWVDTIKLVIQSRQSMAPTTSTLTANPQLAAARRNSVTRNSVLLKNPHLTRKGMALRPSIFAALNSPTPSPSHGTLNLPISPTSTIPGTTGVATLSLPMGRMRTASECALPPVSEQNLRVPESADDAVDDLLKGHIRGRASTELVTNKEKLKDPEGDREKDRKKPTLEIFQERSSSGGSERLSPSPPVLSLHDNDPSKVESVPESPDSPDSADYMQKAGTSTSALPSPTESEHVTQKSAFQNVSVTAPTSSSTFTLSVPSSNVTLDSIASSVLFSTNDANMTLNLTTASNGVNGTNTTFVRQDSPSKSPTTTQQTPGSPKLVFPNISKLVGLSSLSASSSASSSAVSSPKNSQQNRPPAAFSAPVSPLQSSSSPSPTSPISLKSEVTSGGSSTLNELSDVLQPLRGSSSPTAVNTKVGRRLSYKGATRPSSLPRDSSLSLNCPTPINEVSDAEVAAEIDRSVDRSFSESFIMLDQIVHASQSTDVSAETVKSLMGTLKAQMKQSLLKSMGGILSKFSEDYRSTPSPIPNSEGIATPLLDAAGSKISVVSMVEQIDIDEDTKEWIASTYSQEKLKTPRASGTNPDKVGILLADTQQMDHIAMKNVKANREKLSNISDRYSISSNQEGDLLNANSPSSALSPLTSPMASPSPSPFPSSLPIDVNRIADWDWNIFDYDPMDLHVVVAAMLNHFNFLEVMKVSADVLTNWTHAVRKNYFEQPYHNWVHAVDVAQSVYSMLVAMGGYAFLSPLERFAILIAALCHDLRHPALNNIYQINARTPLAIIYNDLSVLENHHAACAFRILEDRSCNIFANLANNDYRSIRTAITAGILSSDMARHFSLLEQMNGLLETKAAVIATSPGFSSTNAPLSPTLQRSSQTSLSSPQSSSPSSPPLPCAVLSDADRTIILNVLLHACDISNPAKLWPLQKKWSDGILQEFLSQGDLEKQQGLQVSPNMDRDTTTQDALSINFIDFIVAPLFVSVRQLLPPLQVACIRIKDNRSHWAKLLSKRVEASNKSRAEKAMEKARWVKRNESFHLIMLPTETKRRGHSHVHNPSDQSSPQNRGSPPLSSSPQGVRSSPQSSISSIVADSTIHRRRNSLVMLNQFALANAKKDSTVVKDEEEGKDGEKEGSTKTDPSAAVSPSSPPPHPHPPHSGLAPISVTSHKNSIEDDSDDLMSPISSSPRALLRNQSIRKATSVIESTEEREKEKVKETSKEKSSNGSASSGSEH